MKKKILKSLEIILYVILALLICITLILKFHIFGLFIYKAEGTSNYPTVHNNDLWLAIKINENSTLNRFDVVGIDAANWNDGLEKIMGNVEKSYSKRIVGLPGEHVVMKDGRLYINDNEIEDKYAANVGFDFDVTLKDNEYFVLGDNRQNSLDSVLLGPVQRKAITDKRLFLVWRTE